jgi:hypothetical protein
MLILALLIRYAIGQRRYYHPFPPKYIQEVTLSVLEFILKWISNILIFLLSLLLLADWINHW